MREGRGKCLNSRMSFKSRGILFVNIMRKLRFKVKLSTIFSIRNVFSLLWFVYAIEIKNLVGQSVKCIFGR